MPEGHTVHRLARTFHGLLVGQVLRVSSPQGRFADGAALLDGQVLAAAEAWGKQLFLGFAAAPAGATAERWLRVHLGMYGAWTFAGDGSADVVHAIGAPRRRIGERETVPAAGPDDVTDDARADGEGWVPPAPRGAVRVRLLGGHAVADLTGPTACEVVTPGEKAAVEARLGPDPLRADGGRGSPEAARADFVEHVRRSRVPVGRLLMDQGVIAGVGNVYRAEVLYRARMDPMRPGHDVPASELARLWDDLAVLMRDGVARGYIVTTQPEHRDAGDGAAVPGVAGRARRRPRQNAADGPDAVPVEEAFYVYRRDGLPCRMCGNPVLTRELAGRNLYWCGTCQG